MVAVIADTGERGDHQSFWGVYQYWLMLGRVSGSEYMILFIGRNWLAEFSRGKKNGRHWFVVVLSEGWV